MAETRDVRVEHGHHPTDDGPGVWIRTPFDGEFVDEIKRIPWEHRAWSEDDRMWFVREDYAERATDLVVHHFGETIVVHADGSEEYRDRTGTTARQERLL
jgi:hypothetical protein